MMDLKMDTTNVDSLFRWLLASTTETNCTVLERSCTMSCGPSHVRIVYQLKLSVADDTKDTTDVIENHALFSVTVGLFEESC